MAGIVLCQIRKSVPQSQKFHRTNICCVVKLNYIKCRESADLKCTTGKIYYTMGDRGGDMRPCDTLPQTSRLLSQQKGWVLKTQGRKKLDIIYWQAFVRPLC